MDINKVTSDLKFEGCSIRSMEITNNTISFDANTEAQLELGVDTKYIGISDKLHRGIVIMQININATHKESDATSIIKTTFEGQFCSSATLDENEFMKKLAISGAAALYSIARGRIDAISSCVFFNGKIDIPLVNFLEYYREQFEIRNP